MDVVDQQHVDPRYSGGRLAAVEADRVDHLVDEAFGGDVEDVEPLLARQDVVADRMHEVGLAETHAAVDEERVVGLRGDLGDRRAAAWANWFEEPTTKLSKVYLGLRWRGSRSAGGGAGSRGVDPPSGSSKTIRTRGPDLGQGLLEHAQVVLAQPLSELGVGHADAQRVGRLREEARGPKPGGEAVAVDLAFDTGEDLIPQVFGHRAWTGWGPEGSAREIRFISNI